MFGYIYVNEQELKLKEYHTYRSFYCGLCHSLQQNYGRTAQMMLNYDLTFLALLLTGLYEPETAAGKRRCMVHPAKAHLMVENEAVDYAADMCVLLSWQKLADDWRDEKKPGGKVAADLLRTGYERAAERYPRQVQAIEKNIRLLHKAERRNCRDIDAVSGLTGRFLGEVFVWKEDLWQDDLRAMGFYLGKFIYLMDALEDLEKDRRQGGFNLFADAGEIWGNEQEIRLREILTEMMAEASRAFERLPIIENAEIMRNVLYSGVWCKYTALRQRDEEKRKRAAKGERRVKARE